MLKYLYLSPLLFLSMSCTIRDFYVNPNVDSIFRPTAHKVTVENVDMAARHEVITLPISIRYEDPHGMKKIEVTYGSRTDYSAEQTFTPPYPYRATAVYQVPPIGIGNKHPFVIKTTTVDPDSGADVVHTLSYELEIIASHVSFDIEYPKTRPSSDTWPVSAKIVITIKTGIAYKSGSVGSHTLTGIPPFTVTMDEAGHPRVPAGSFSIPIVINGINDSVKRTNITIK